MCNTFINTKKNENRHELNSINNVYSFSTDTGTSQVAFSSSTVNYVDNDNTVVVPEKESFYCINSDWFQILVKTEKDVYNLDKYETDRIKIIRCDSVYNPNFRNGYLITLDGDNICEVSSVPLNRNHGNDEISIKMSNHILFTYDWTYKLEYIIEKLEFELLRYTMFHIALDGSDLLKKMEYFRRYMRNKTVVSNNRGLAIEGIKFNKNELLWESYTIGSKKYGKHAILYNKTAELIKSKKNYIFEYWQKNNMNTSEQIGRFELKLSNRHLKKYDIKSLHLFNDTNFLVSIFENEIRNWLKLYKVKFDDISNRKKSIAIKNGKEIKYIRWDKLPKSTYKLTYVTDESDGIQEAKRTITRAINELQKEYRVDSTATLINFICVTSTEYNLISHVTNKINKAVLRNPDNSNLLKLEHYFMRY